MKFRNVFIALGMIGMLTGGYAREAGSPKAMGAGFAKLSGQAQLELMVDRWRSQAAIRGNASLQGLSAATLREPAELLVAGESAEVHFEDGSLVRLQRSGETWVISSVVQAQAREVDETPAAPAYLVAGGNFTAGETFVARSISEEHHIERLSKTVTRQNLDRELFGAPEKSAAYYAATYRNKAPFVTASYVQFVIDPAWDRLMYGSLENWIKSYGDLRGPSAITVDPQGRVFVGESGRNRISVLQLSGDGANAELVFRYAIEEVGVPTDLAHFDNGTPLDISDDALYMVDAASGELKRYDLSESGAVEAGSWDLFVSPTLVQVGRSNGSSNSLVYVVDEVGKRLQQFDLAGGQPLLMGTHTAGNDQYFSALKADHFGHLYAVDHMNSRIEKFSADLELLDRSGDRETYQGLTGLDLPFGKITIEGEGTYWSGFDQLFTLERWSENSGAQRRQLGLAIRNGELVADADFAGITGNYRLTDVAEVTVRVRNADGELIRTVPGGWQNAGDKTLAWDRRNEAGEQVRGGVYRFEIAAHSPYTDQDVLMETEFNLPEYLWQNAGTRGSDNAYLIQGQPQSWGEGPQETVDQDPDAVVYRISGLNPEGEYQVRVEALANDGLLRRQRVVANGEVLADDFRVGDSPSRTGYLDIPAAALANGWVDIRIENADGGSAVVSQLWFKETASGFTARQINKDGALPTEFGLSQNYPNPFNPTTTIAFQLPERADVELAIYNVLGQQVRLLTRGAMEAGSYQLQWDGRNAAGNQVASGIYLYRLRAGEFVQSRQMLLLK